MNNQQLRFFQAATSAGLTLNQRAQRFQHAWIAVTLTALFLCSCQSPTRKDSLTVGLAGQSAEAGTRSWLKEHPDHREAFRLVSRDTRASTNLALCLASLPTGTLTGPRGEVYVTDQSILIYDGKMPRMADADARRDILAGLRRGLEPLPPMPAKAKRWTPPLTIEGRPLAVESLARFIAIPYVRTDSTIVPGGTVGIYSVERFDGSNWVEIQSFTGQPAQMRIRRVR